MVAALRKFQEKHFRISALCLALVLAVLTVAFLSAMASFVYPYFSTSHFRNDGAMFYYMGTRLAAGETPYIDIYDHKGLYIFYYTGLGALMGGRIGLFIVQSVFFCASYYVLIHIAKVLKLRNSWAITLCLAVMGSFVAGGQSPSDVEPVLPLLMAAMYFLLKGRKENSPKAFLLSNLFAGLAAGVSMNIRLSDAMVPFSFVVGYLCFVVLDKERTPGQKARNLLLNAVVCVGGIAVAYIPPLLHAYRGGFLKEMFDAVIFSNFSYLGSVVSGTDSTWLKALVLLGFLLAFFPLVYKRKEIGIQMFASCLAIMTVQALIQFMIAYYPHYFLISVPCLWVFLFDIGTYYRVKKFFKGLIVGITVLTQAIGIAVLPTLYHVVQRPIDSSIKQFVEATVEEEAKDEVLCYMTSPGIYLNSGLISPWQDFAVQVNHMAISESVGKEAIYDFLSSGQAKYVIFMDEIGRGDDIVRFVKEGINLDGLRQKKKFALVDGSDFEGDRYIDIYRYVG